MLNVYAPGKENGIICRNDSRVASTCRATPRTNSFHMYMLNHLTYAMTDKGVVLRVVMVRNRRRMSTTTGSAFHAPGRVDEQEQQHLGLISSDLTLRSGHDVPMRPDDLDDYHATRWEMSLVSEDPPMVGRLKMGVRRIIPVDGLIGNMDGFDGDEYAILVLD